MIKRQSSKVWWISLLNSIKRICLRGREADWMTTSGVYVANISFIIGARSTPKGGERLQDVYCFDNFVMQQYFDCRRRAWREAETLHKKIKPLRMLPTIRSWKQTKTSFIWMNKKQSSCCVIHLSTIHTSEQNTTNPGLTPGSRVQPWRLTFSHSKPVKSLAFQCYGTYKITWVGIKNSVFQLWVLVSFRKMLIYALS